MFMCHYEGNDIREIKLDLFLELSRSVTFSCNSFTSVTVPWHLAHDLMRWLSLAGNDLSSAIQVSLRNNNVMLDEN